MSLIYQTRYGAAARVTLELCPNLPEGRQTVEIPAPGIKFRCPTPCGATQCLKCPTVPALPAVEFQPALRLLLSLRATKQGLAARPMDLVQTRNVQELLAFAGAMSPAELLRAMDEAEVLREVHRN